MRRQQFWWNAGRKAQRTTKLAQLSVLDELHLKRHGGVLSKQLKKDAQLIIATRPVFGLFMDAIICVDY